MSKLQTNAIIPEIIFTHRALIPHIAALRDGAGFDSY